MIPIPSDLPRGAAVARRRGALEQRLCELGARPAPVPDAADVARLRDADALLLQFTRAGRRTAGTVRAYASLITDAHDDPDTDHWVARIDKAMDDLDAYVARVGTLRVCDGERPTRIEWKTVLDSVANHCRGVSPCLVEVVDRTRDGFRQRSELVARVIVHLVRNAIESTPRGGRVRMRVDEGRIGSERFVHVRVIDEGPDWDVSQSPLIWRPYVTGKPGHAGLGLAYVSVCAPILGAVAGIRREMDRTIAHLLLPEESEIEWESSS